MTEKYGKAGEDVLGAQDIIAIAKSFFRYSTGRKNPNPP
jgi:hypothetical protein